ncbi:MAG TPA: DUF4157 domain-containing protein, partial [Kofleriaceae bacterium]|nr:DUF4157 domain-containing protein [Kofleriaceae bacterium]
MLRVGSTEHGGRGDEAASERAPGKRSLTERLPIQRRAGGAAPAAAEVARAAEVVDDPYGVHLPVQRKGGEETAGVHAAAARGVEAPATALPHGERIQQSFGPAHDVSRITAHVGGAAGEATAAMGATAYATGEHVVFGASPDLHTAAHEAA